jgi:hypothetical protein
MKSFAAILLFVTCLVAHAELPFKLPPNAKYTVSEEAISRAKTELSSNLVADAATLTNLFASPMMCGPELWSVLKSSPHFSKPPLAKGTAKIPLADGKYQELPIGFFQSEDEVMSFRKALADLLASQGKLTIREPNEDEFKKFWGPFPFDEIGGPLLVALGKDATLVCQFQGGKVLWVDEVKRTADAAKEFQATNIVLYQPDAVLRERLTDVNDFANFIKAVEKVCADHYATINTAESLAIVVAIKPKNKARFWFISSRDTPDRDFDALREKLAKVPVPAVVSGPVAFAIRSGIAGGRSR